MNGANNKEHGAEAACGTQGGGAVLVALEEARRAHPQFALRRDQIIAIFEHFGLGGVRFYRALKASGTLIPLRGLRGAKQARYGKEHVLALVADALLPMNNGRQH